MTTNNEKIMGLILGSVIGGIVSCIYINKNNITKKDRLRYMIGGSIGGGFSGYLLSILLGSLKDTINYQLFNGNKRVYHGITFNDRVPLRKLEHIASGKLFTKMVCDNPKPRSEALKLERTLIKKHNPIYNIQHKN